MKKIMALCAFLFYVNFTYAQYTGIESRNISSSPTLYIVYHGNDVGYADCVRRSHTLPTGPLTGSYVTQTLTSLSWIGSGPSPMPSAFNGINIVRPLSGGGTESAPLKPPFVVTFPVSGTTVTVTMINLGVGMLRIDIS